MPLSSQIRIVFLGLLLLAGCMHTKEQPTPTSSPTLVQRNIYYLKQIFLDSDYDDQLIQQITNPDQTKGSWTWTPLWEQATQQRVQDSATYVYVPLEPRTQTRPYVITMVGVKKYLLIKQTSREISFSEASYLFSEKQNLPFTERNIRAFFASFTGILQVKNLATGTMFPFVYESGHRQLNPANQKSAKGSSRSQSCYTTVTCYWTGHCRSEMGGENMTYGTTTYGLGFCGSPSDDGVGCSSIAWTLNDRQINTHCSPDGSGDPGPDPGGCTGCSGTGGPGNGTTPPNPNTPCGKMTILGNQSAFQEKSASLIGMLSGTNEVGFLYRNNGVSAIDYVSMIGGPTGINWSPPFRLDGDMHIHNLDANNPDDKALAVPSPDDLTSLYTLERDGFMVDPLTYTSSVFTAFGERYAMKIDDINKFHVFGANYLAGGQTVMSSYFFCPTCPYPLKEGNASMTSDGTFKANSERNFLKFLKDFNSGIKLLKYEPTNYSTLLFLVIDFEQVVS